jgi:hypothetical protein
LAFQVNGNQHGGGGDRAENFAQEIAALRRLRPRLRGRMSRLAMLASAGAGCPKRERCGAVPR